MVSSDQQQLALRKLSQWIDNDKRIVTFRELSREVGCHVNTAKNLLLHYYNANTSLSPTYLLSGPLKSTSRLALTQLEPAPPSPTATQSLAHLATQGVRIVDMDQMSDADRNSEPDEEDEMGMRNDGQWPGNDQGEEDGMGVGVKVERVDEEVEPEEVPRWGMVLVQDDALEDKKELFESASLSIHIYALAPARIKDPAQYLISTDGLRTHKAYYSPEVYGTITGEGFKTAASAPLKDGGMDWSGRKVVTKDEKKIDAKVVMKKKVEEEKEEEKAVESRKGQLRKTESVDSKKATSSVKEKDPKKAPARASGKAKKRIITSDTEEDEAEASSAPVAGSSKEPLEPTSSMARADDKAAMEAMMSMEFDMDAESGDEGKSTPKTKSKSSSGKAKTDEVIKIKTEPGQRKRRKVKHQVQEQNAKGYTVTRDEWREESYSGESEPEPEPPTAAKTTQGIPPPSIARKASETKKLDPPRPQSKPAAKPAAGKKGGQGTLTGFFKKL